MFSATWPPEVRALARSFMDPRSGVVRVSVGSPEAGLRANARVSQRFLFPGDDKQKRKFLFNKLLGGEVGASERVLVFCGRKDTCAKLTKEIAAHAGGDTTGSSDPPPKNNKERKKRKREMKERARANGYGADKVRALHGDLKQHVRDEALRAFKAGSVRVLVATDVAARGLDVSSLKHVINYDFPQTCADYVHRIGRTARAGCEGTSWSFFTGADAKLSHELVEILEEAEQPIPKQLAKFAAQPRPQAQSNNTKKKKKPWPYRQHQQHHRKVGK